MSSEPDETLSTLRHDLRTPLNQIIGYAELVQELAEEDGQEELESYAGRILKAARHQLERLNDALETARAIGRGETVRVPEARDSLKSIEAAPVEAGYVPAAEDAPAPADARTGRILVVDDEAGNRELLETRLARAGYEVGAAPTGERALAMLDEDPYDLVLLDVMMPGMSGVEVLKQVRLRWSREQLPVIMATARNESSEVVQALRLGANDYVTKPIDQPVLLARAATQLDLKRTHERIQEMAVQLRARSAFIRQTFGRYLTDEIVESILDAPEGLELGGESRKVTILMSDLRGFSSMAERLPPQQVMQVLNRYLGRMTEVILEHQGTIDEFIGDAILVIFGAPRAQPDDTARAVACALSMQLALVELNRDGEALGQPRLEMGIGLNTGEVVVGNIGSERRAKYGVVGRNVNLASRIEAFTLPGQVLASESTLREVEGLVRVDSEMVVCPKGAKQPMTIYEIGAIGAPFDVALPGRDLRLFTLREAIPLRFVVLDGVSAPEPNLDGALVALSPTLARVRADGARFDDRATVKIELMLGPNEPVPGAILGKTVAGAADEAGFTVCFTHVDAALEELVLRLAAAAEDDARPFAWRPAQPTETKSTETQR